MGVLKNPHCLAYTSMGTGYIYQMLVKLPTGPSEQLDTAQHQPKLNLLFRAQSFSKCILRSPDFKLCGDLLTMQIYSTSWKMNWVLKNKFEPWFKKTFFLTRMDRLNFPSMSEWICHKGGPFPVAGLIGICSNIPSWSCFSGVPDFEKMIPAWLC